MAKNKNNFKEAKEQAEKAFNKHKEDKPDNNKKTLVFSVAFNKSAKANLKRVK